MESSQSEIIIRQQGVKDQSENCIRVKQEELETESSQSESSILEIKDGGADDEDGNFADHLRAQVDRQSFVERLYAALEGGRGGGGGGGGRIRG